MILRMEFSMTSEGRSISSWLRQAFACSRLVAIGMFLVVLATVLCSPPAQSAEPDAALWKALHSGGHVALLRHALAPAQAIRRISGCAIAGRKEIFQRKDANRPPGSASCFALTACRS